MAHDSAYHFKGDVLSRSQLIERTVVECIIASVAKIPDNERTWGMAFELKHSSGVIQIGRLLAQKRGLNPELAGIACVLHDIYVNETGDDTSHAARGAAIAEQMLRDTKKFTDTEIALITQAIKNHSDKHIVSDSPYDELVKDADVFECCLYENGKAAYLACKTVETCRIYFARVQKIRAELGLPNDSQWDI